jgi:hypothetical protein
MLDCSKIMIYLKKKDPKLFYRLLKCGVMPPHDIGFKGGTPLIKY